jgi:drug/metabolite transporter (DMT)-like permease
VIPRQCPSAGGLGSVCLFACLFVCCLCSTLSALPSLWMSPLQAVILYGLSPLFLTVFPVLFDS